MSVGSVTSIPPGAGRGTRRSVSIYDRLEDARERRASVLSRQPATIPSANKPALPAVKPQHQPPAEPEAKAVIAAPEPAAQTNRHKATKWTIRGLSVLLIILTSIAVHTAQEAPPETAPDFVPPVVSLTPQAYGAPLLATIPRRDDPVPMVLEPLKLSGAAVGGQPIVDVSAPAPKGPVLQGNVDRPVAPAANPGSLITLPAGLRPAERPKLTTLAQGSN